MNKRSIPILVLTLLAAALPLYGQGKPYDGPDDPAGDVAAEREGYMTGNRVFLYFQNNTELADWPREEVSKWPNDYTGTKMTDGVNILITAQVYLENETVPVTDPEEIARRSDLDTLWFCETSFRGGMDMDPTGTIEWGLYPVFGYFNEAGGNEYPAMSNLPISWPPDGWPARGNEKKWPGVWNGRFGLGVMYADLETYFVANDAHDQEYLEESDTLKYYPRPGMFIGDKKPDVTIQYGKPWGGLGMRVETRGYQWNNPLARDAIFWEYNISNISEYDLPEAAFGYHVDNAIGSDNANDELGFFDTYLDMAYSWDIDGVGKGGLATGTMGFAFLESPGIPYDGVDNDEDGLLDEKRDNNAVNKIGPTEGIDDLDKFLTYYRLKPEELVEHWDADEDQDWIDGVDSNGDGLYQIEENPGDDVGLDGIGPAELNYPGPDQGECNHKPDFLEGLGCEPNFAATDVTESDMLGLTSFNLFQVTEQLDGQPRTFHADWVMWQLTGTGREEIWEAGISNLIEVFGSGPFPLYKGRTERISMSILHSFDDLSGLMETPPKSPVLFELKKVVQLIYEKDYRFAQPPKMPTLTATPGDGYVVLTWDNIADVASREPFLGGINDFEGYKLFRSTDKKFQDSRVVTDGYGSPTLLKPIFQCDLKDHREGFTDFGLLNGMGYYLGGETGITHYFVDRNVQNGRTYYYGLVAFDYGISDSLAPPGIAPSENNLVIELDEFENIRYVGQNVQVATPHQMAQGYTPPSIEILANSIKASSGSVEPELIARNALKENHIYTLKFSVDTLVDNRNSRNQIWYLCNGYTIYDVTDSAIVVVSENPQSYAGDNLIYYNVSVEEGGDLKRWVMKTQLPFKTDAADGIVLNIKSNAMTAEFGGYDFVNSGWSVGSALVTVLHTSDAPKYYPWDYELIFTGDAEAYTAKSKIRATMRNAAGEKVPEELLLDQLSYSFFMINKDFPTEDGGYDTLDVVAIDADSNGIFDILADSLLFGDLDARGRWNKTVFVMKFDEEPQPQDVYYLTFNRPFFSTDSLTYRVLPEGPVNLAEIEDNMDRIKVVPNPYVASNIMEPVVANWSLNQRRRLMFTHLPASCDIKIFTMSGVLVAEIPVDNPAPNGTIHWDLKSEEGLEVAAGMYLYHVKARETQAEKIGKFAIIK